MTDFSKLYLNVYDEPIELTPESVQHLWIAIHSYLTRCFVSYHESFPRFEDMTEYERQLLKLESDLERFIYSRGYIVPHAQ